MDLPVPAPTAPAGRDPDFGKGWRNPRRDLRTHFNVCKSPDLQRYLLGPESNWNPPPGHEKTDRGTSRPSLVQYLFTSVSSPSREWAK